MANELRKSIQDVLMEAGRGYHLNLDLIKELEKKVIETNPDEEIFTIGKIELIDSCIVKSAFIASVNIHYDDKTGTGYGFSTPAFLFVKPNQLCLTVNLPFESDMQISLEDMLFTMAINVKA